MADEDWRKACEILGQIRLELGRGERNGRRVIQVPLGDRIPAI